MDSNSELGKFIYCVINIGLIFLSAVLGRRVFIVFGTLGVFGYLGHLAYSVFKDSMMFPFALSALGLLLMYLGVKYQKYERQVNDWVHNSFGKKLVFERSE